MGLADACSKLGLFAFMIGCTQVADGPAPPEHLLISEVAIGPDGFIELWNPTDQSIDVVYLALSDNPAYIDVANSGTWRPEGKDGLADFVISFPMETNVPPDGVVVIAMSDSYESVYGACPDYYIFGSTTVRCGGREIPTMATVGSAPISDEAALASDEMLVLFTIPAADEPKVDIDYLAWGDSTKSTRMDKTGHDGYADETPRDAQRAAPSISSDRSLERCAIDVNETLSGGNGVTGHDETSEDLAQSFLVQDKPSPGKKNACL